MSFTGGGGGILDIGTTQRTARFSFACCLNALQAEGMCASIQRRAVVKLTEADGALLLSNWLPDRLHRLVKRLLRMLLSVLRMLLPMLRTGLLLDALHPNLLQPMLPLCHSWRDASQSGGGRGEYIERHIHGLEHGSNRRHVEHRPFSLDGGLDCGAEAGGRRSSIIRVAGNADDARCWGNHTSRCDRIVSVWVTL